MFSVWTVQEQVAVAALDCGKFETTAVSIIWAASWQNQQNDCVHSTDSDQPEHPPSLIRVFAVRSMSSQGPKLSSCRQWRLINYAGCTGDFVGFVMLWLIWAISWKKGSQSGFALGFFSFANLIFFFGANFCKSGPLFCKSHKSND